MTISVQRNGGRKKTNNRHTDSKALRNSILKWCDKTSKCISSFYKYGFYKCTQQWLLFITKCSNFKTFVLSHRRFCTWEPFLLELVLVRNQITKTSLQLAHISLSTDVWVCKNVALNRNSAYDKHSISHYWMIFRHAAKKHTSNEIK